MTKALKRVKRNLEDFYKTVRKLEKTGNIMILIAFVQWLVLLTDT